MNYFVCAVCVVFYGWHAIEDFNKKDRQGFLVYLAGIALIIGISMLLQGHAREVL